MAAELPEKQVHLGFLWTKGAHPSDEHHVKKANQPSRLMRTSCPSSEFNERIAA